MSAQDQDHQPCPNHQPCPDHQGQALLNHCGLNLGCVINGHIGIGMYELIQLLHSRCGTMLYGLNQGQCLLLSNRWSKS